MDKIVDARGLECPQPVVLTNKALDESEKVITIVDNEVAKENVSRLARSKGFGVAIKEKEGLFYLHLTRESSQSGPTPEKVVNGLQILLISSDAFGRGSDDLGQVLMRSFLHTLNEVSPLPDKIICLNSGVKLVVEGSSVLDDLRALEKKGIRILACGTCLGYYEIKEKIRVGQISNMYDIAESLLGAEKIIEL
jgi:selenium metabolism protein YedF